MTTIGTGAPNAPKRDITIPEASVTSLPTSTAEAREARERWIDAACRGDLSGEQLGEKLGIPAAEAQAIVDALGCGTSSRASWTTTAASSSAAGFGAEERWRMSMQDRPSGAGA